MLIQPLLRISTLRLCGQTLLLLHCTAAAFLARDSSSGVDYYSASELQSRAGAQSRKLTAPSNLPVASPLNKYVNDYTLLVYRNATGQSELHEHEADLYLVLDGEATLVSGGTMLGKSVKSGAAAGEYIGTGISGGRSQTLKKGDIVRIAPNLPHQLQIQTGRSFSYFVEKVKE